MSKIKTLNRIVVGSRPVTTENVWINTTKDTPTISVFENNKWKEVANAGGGSGDIKGDIIPAETGKYNLGDETHKYKEANAVTVNAEDVNASSVQTENNIVKENLVVFGGNYESAEAPFVVNGEGITMTDPNDDTVVSHLDWKHLCLEEAGSFADINNESITIYDDNNTAILSLDGLVIERTEQNAECDVIINSANGTHKLSEKVNKVDPVPASVGADNIPNLTSFEVHELIDQFIAGQNPRIVSDNLFGSVVSADIKHNILIISMINTQNAELMYYRYIATDGTHVEKSAASACIFN